MRKRTPLYDAHRSAGARMVDFGGYDMPVNYGSQIDEHHAVRRDAGMFDVSHMRALDLTGAGARDFLRYALANNVDKLKEPGKALYSCLLRPDGGVLDDLIVYRLGEDEYMVVANAANVPVVASALAARASDFDVEVIDESSTYSLIAVQGPRAVDILAPLTDANLDEIRYYAGYEHTVAGHPVLLARTGYTGEDGFEIFVKPADKAPEIWQALMAEGEQHGLIPAGLSSRDTLRMEAGMPLYGQELSADLTPFDAGLGRVVKLDKPGDFVGRAALEEASRTARERRLIGLAARGRRPLRKGQDVLRDGAVVGTISSGAPSPTLGRPIAMAYVDGDLDTASGTFSVDVRGRSEEVDVVELPFYKRQS